MTRFSLLDDDASSDDESNQMMDESHDDITDTPEKHDIDVDPYLVGEEDGMDDAAVVSDIEVDKETEAAYFNLIEQVKMKGVESPAAEPNLFEREAEEEIFEDEGEISAADHYERIGRSPSRRTKAVSEEDYLWAASSHGGGGITSRLASKAFVGERRIPSSSDCYKIRQTFGVAWGPNGSFTFIKNGPGALTRCRPVLKSQEGPSIETSVNYLKTHMKSARKIPTSVDDRSPRFVLPPAIENSGDVSSHAALHKTLEAYAEQASSDKIGKLVFALLAALVDTEESVQKCEDEYGAGKHVMFNQRRREAVLRFLVNACKSTVDAEVQEAMANNDVCSAIYSSLTGGDLDRACKLAFDNGHEDLAICLSTFDVEGKLEMQRQVHLAATGSLNIQPEILRIYKLLTGNLKDEENRHRKGASNIDWMRRVIMRLLYSPPRRADFDISEVIASYMNDVESGLAPYPKPQYNGAPPGVECILYRLLRLTVSSHRASCLEVIEPSAITKCPHDYTLAFHIAAVISASMGIYSSQQDEEKILSGYVSQLVSAGHWEWALYACLCSLNPDTLESSSTDWKRQKAKELVLQNFNMQDPNANRLQKFLLEDVGVPKEWLSEALATRCASSGDPFEFIQHLSMFDPSKAASVVEQVIVPNLLFMNGVNLEKAIALLDAFTKVSPLSSALLNLIGLTDDINSMAVSPREVSPELLSEMFQVCREIEQILLSRRAETSNMKDPSSMKFYSAYFDIIPASAMFSEALERLSFLRLLLKAIEKGIPISSEISKKKLKSQLAFMTMDVGENFQSPNIIRGLR